MHYLSKYDNFTIYLEDKDELQEERMKRLLLVVLGSVLLGEGFETKIKSCSVFQNEVRLDKLSLERKC
jgi:hypothetical protein